MCAREGKAVDNEAARGGGGTGEIVEDLNPVIAAARGVKKLNPNIRIFYGEGVKVDSLLDVGREGGLERNGTGSKGVGQRAGAGKADVLEAEGVGGNRDALDTGFGAEVGGKVGGEVLVKPEIEEKSPHKKADKNQGENKREQTHKNVTVGQREQNVNCFKKLIRF